MNPVKKSTTAISIRYNKKHIVIVQLYFYRSIHELISFKSCQYILNKCKRTIWVIPLIWTRILYIPYNILRPRRLSCNIQDYNNFIFFSLLVAPNVCWSYSLWREWIGYVDGCSMYLECFVCNSFTCVSITGC